MNTPRNAHVCIISFPFHSSKDTGRGIDRVLFEWVNNIPKLSDKIHIDLLDQGFSKSVLSASLKTFNLISGLIIAKADLYHALTPIGGAAAALLGKSPLVVTIHDVIPFHVRGYDYAWKRHLMRFCIKISLKKCSAVIVPYHVTKQDLASRFKGISNKIKVINYGVDHSTYFPRPHIKRHELRVLYIGEVSCSKGVDILIRAFGIIKKTICSAELVIGGKQSKDQPMLEKLSHNLGIADVTFKGFIPEAELPEYYSTTTVMVFPSRCGFGLSSLEAMACGTPVIVASTLDAPEFIGDGGMLVRPDDPEDLAKAITLLLTEKDLRRQLGEKAIERAKLFSWEKMARDVLSTYNEVIEHGR